MSVRKGPANALNVLTDLQIRFPNLLILLAKADVTDAFRNVRVAPDQVQKYCYMIDDVLVADFRLTFGGAGSPGHWGVMSEASAHFHRNTTVETPEILPEGKAMMSQVKIAEPWEIDRPTRSHSVSESKTTMFLGVDPMNPSLPPCVSITSSWHA